jgi:purine-nucleoside phosphorylase
MRPTDLQTDAGILKDRGFGKADVAIILGSGLGRFAELLEGAVTVPTSLLPHVPRPTIAGHSGRVHFGSIPSAVRGSPSLLVFEGRLHVYESGTPSSAQSIVYLASLLGASRIIVTSAAGGFGPGMRQGDLMLHEGIISYPTRFHQRMRNSAKGVLESPYDAELSARMMEASVREGIGLRRGIYCWVTGPSYETPAEVRMLRALGGDAVGMSTLPEVVAAQELGMRVVGISLISNLASGLGSATLSHQDVTDAAREGSETLSRLLISFLSI